MKRKALRVERFLEEMDKVVPWVSLVERIKPYYKSSGGRRPHDLEMMVRIHFLQLWHNLSDPGMEEALYDRLSFQKFLGFDCFGGVIPDESSICRFRHLLQEHGLSLEILSCVNDHLASRGLVLKEGTIVDATVIAAPISKQNKSRARDPEMSSTRKNNIFMFGAKGHIGVQANGRPIIHSCAFGTARDHDIKAYDALLHGEEKAVFGDGAYNTREDKRQARALGIYYGVNDKGQRKHPLSPKQQKKNKRLSRLRAKVEHPFRVIKHLWGHYKLRYKGIAKNAAQFTTLCALSNLYLCRRELLATG